MFGIDYGELLVVAVVALVVIGPKDLPRVMRTVGQWVGRARGMARHFRSGIDTMIRESELEEMEKKWREENERIMREHPLGTSWDDPPALPAPPPSTAPAAAWVPEEGDDVGERGVTASDAADVAPVAPDVAPDPAAEMLPSAPVPAPTTATPSLIKDAAVTAEPPRPEAGQYSFLPDASPRSDDPQDGNARRELP